MADSGAGFDLIGHGGTELTSMAILAWSKGTGVDWHYFIGARSRTMATFTPASTMPSSMRTSGSLFKTSLPPNAASTHWPEAPRLLACFRV